MQELRLESRVMEGVKSTGQKDRRENAECFFEVHSQEPVDKQHLEKPGTDEPDNMVIFF